MIALRPFILYSLPKNRTSQVFRKGKKVEIIWEDLKVFFESCTTINIERPTNIELTVYEAYKSDKNSELAQKIIYEAKTVFGEGEISAIAVDYPNATNWKIEIKDLTKTVNYIINGQPWPKFYFGSIELMITYWFKLIDPDTKKELPDQQYESSLLIWLSKNSRCSPDLFFPYSKPDRNFKNYLLQVEKYMPFKLETKYLKLGQSNKSQISNYFRKISVEQ